MPYADTWGFPPYDPKKPGGGWDAETWQRYRLQQRGRAWKPKPKSEQLASHERGRQYRIKGTGENNPGMLAKLDATLARNELGPRPPDLPDAGYQGNATRGHRSAAQIAYDRQVERRAQMQARRDRLAAELAKGTKLEGERAARREAARTAAGTPKGTVVRKATTDKATTPSPGATAGATPAKATPGQSAYADVTTGIPIAKAAATAPASPGAIARANTPTAYAARAANTPPPNLPTVTAMNAGAQAAINAQPGAIAQTGKATRTTPKQQLPAAGRSDWATEQRQKSRDPYIIQQQKGSVAKQAKRVAGYTPTPGKSKDQAAPAPKKALPTQSKAVDQDREAARAKEQMANKLRTSKAWSKTPKMGAPKGQKTGRQPSV